MENKNNSKRADDAPAVQRQERAADLSTVVARGAFRALKAFKRSEKHGESQLERANKLLELLTKLIVICAVLVAVWKFSIFREATEIINSTIEYRTLHHNGRNWLEATVKVTNSGKVRAYLEGGVLRVSSLEPGTNLAFQLPGAAIFSSAATVTNIYELDQVKFRPAKDSNILKTHTEFFSEGELFFDPTETITMRFLFEYQGEGLCNISVRCDGKQSGSVWCSEIYAILSTNVSAFPVAH